MIERFFENPVIPTPEIPEEKKAGEGLPTGSPDEGAAEGLRICVGCGKEFMGDPNTNEPFCPECREKPFRPENVPF